MQIPHSTFRAAFAGLLLLFTSQIAGAQSPPCQPCAGLRVSDPAALADSLAAGPALEQQHRLYVSWRVPAEGAAEQPAAGRLEELGATPWPVMTFSTPAPLVENLSQLERELAGLAAVAAGTGSRGHVQIDWRPDGQPITVAQAPDLGFLIKRAAVTVSGANSDARVIVGPLPNEPGLLASLYAEEVAAYVDGIAVVPGDDDEITAMKGTLDQLDPGRPLVIDSLEMPEIASRALALAADSAENGVAVTFFRTPAEADLTPLKLLAREFAGDVSMDPYSVPSGGREAWSFVRGDDFSLQVVVEVEPGVDELTLLFAEAQLRDPKRLMADGERLPLLGARQTQKGLELTVADPDPVTVLKLQRLTAAEIEGLAGLDETLTVESERTIPVGEILRRLQAFEDAQARRIQTYSAKNALSMRFQGSGGTGTVEVTFQGDFFFRQGEGYDWAWQEAFVNGVRWRNEKIPQIPLLQPEKASALPAEITFTKDYVYRLRGTAEIDGRDCWVVDFEPAKAVEPGQSLYQGTVWIDRQIYARVRSRTLQLGLRGDVVSNDETISFTPVDANGQPAEWSPESYYLPTRVTGQQIFSLLGAALVMERERWLTAIRVNPPDWEDQRDAVMSSTATMVRDTDQGLRYLVPDKETGERVVQEKLDPSRLFVLGGVFYDEAQDYPIPLAGVNWLSFDYRETGAQVNLFFAGVLAFGNYSNPSLFGSRWEAGMDLFALAIAGTDTLYRGGIENPSEDVETLRPNMDFNLGRNIGNFFKLDLDYSVGWNAFNRASDTSPDFVVPSDHIDHRFGLTARYNRGGYRLRLGGGYAFRDEWEPWGFAGNPDYSPEKEDYITYGAGIAKTWHLPNFLKFGAEVEYVGGEDLDRFSKYQFGPFSDIVVRGYRSELIRAEEAYAVHLSYGFNMGEVFQLRLLGDVAWATDESTGLDNELLGGVGFSGVFVGPWRTVINLDVGKAVAGPDDSVTALIAVLKLFD
jgi:hypothetical protein